jgi:hypothetical protein
MTTEPTTPNPDAGGTTPPVDTTPPATSIAPPSAAAAVTSPAGTTEGTPPVDPNAWAPEKLRVMREDGQIDEAATARKIADSYRGLEAKLGNAAALPPATPADYQFAPGEVIAQAVLYGFLSDPLAQDRIAKMHAAGFTEAQVNLAVNEYLGTMSQVQTAAAQLTHTEAMAELGKLWGSTEEVQAKAVTVPRAIDAFASGEGLPGNAAALYAKFGNDPDFIAFAANVASELGEDQPARTDTLGSSVDVEALQKSKAYWDPNDPQHASVKARVAAFYERQHGVARR